MNVLVVDDFPMIVESLKHGVKWEKTGTRQVYTACSAREAKLVLTNFPVDVMLCDIEMPEENGLELVKWTKERLPDIECIFLTSHAEFDYVKEALRLGSFDYILQPVRFEDVEAALCRVAQRVEQRRRENHMASAAQKAIQQENEMLERMLAKVREEKTADADQICEDYRFLCGMLFAKCAVYQMVVKIVRWKRAGGIRGAKEAGEMLRSDLRMAIGESGARVACAEVEKGCYWLMVFVDQSKMSEEIWRQQTAVFFEEIEKKRDFTAAVFPSGAEDRDGYAGTFWRLLQQARENGEGISGVLAENGGVRSGVHVENPAVGDAIRYIEKNLSKNLSRGEVAQAVHLSEEYFSRLFRQETGETFKDYVLTLKMEAAKEFLEKTPFSVSIVASKVGYSNFSHFSHTFKHYTGMTPQEYRKRNDMEK